MDLESEVREKQVSYIYVGSEKIGIDNLREVLKMEYVFTFPGWLKEAQLRVGAMNP